MCYKNKEIKFMRNFPRQKLFDPVLFDAFEASITNKFTKTSGFYPAGGTHDAVWKNFRHALSEHSASNTHAVAVNGHKREFLDRQKKEIDLLRRSYVKTPTNTLLNLVYHEIRVNMALINHPVFVNFLNRLNVDVGVHHHDRVGATRMYETISRELHQRFLEFVKKSTSPLAIIVDTSSDTHQNLYLVLILRIVENYTPIEVFYKLQMINSEKGELMFQTIVEQFRTDEIENIIKSRLVAFGSDGNLGE